MSPYFKLEFFKPFDFLINLIKNLYLSISNTFMPIINQGFLKFKLSNFEWVITRGLME
jgi:hypothetical protein